MLLRIPALLVAALLPAASARFDNDFSPYPKDAQPCLETADKDSGCDGDTVPEMNRCLCSTGKSSFLEDVARCVGKDAKSDLKRTYKLLGVNCDGSDTSMDMSEDEFLSAADENKPTDTTTTSAPNPTDTDGPGGGGGGGLSSGATIGIAVAVTAVGVGLIAAAIFFLLRRRRLSRAADESNPMLGGGPDPHHASIQASTLRDSSYVSPYQDSELGKTASGVAAWGPDSFNAVSPPMGSERFPTSTAPTGPMPPMGQWDRSRPASWDPAAWGGAGYAPMGGDGAAVQAGGNEVYELASTERAPVEMPGSQPGSQPEPARSASVQQP